MAVLSYETRYAAMMRQRSDAAASTPEAAKARQGLQDALARARADCMARYPTRAPDDAGPAMDYLNERIMYWRATLKV